MPKKKPVDANLLFVLIPSENLWNQANPGSTRKFMRAASRSFNAQPGPLSLAKVHPGLKVKLVDEVAPAETALVVMDDEERVKLQAAEPGLRVAPVVELEPLWLQRFRIATTAGISATGAKQTLEVRVVDAGTGKPLADVDVVGLIDRSDRAGASNKTTAKGVAKLIFPSTVKVLESLEAFAPSGYWPAYASKVAPSSSQVTLSCAPIDLAVPDVRGVLGLLGQDGDGKGVKVAVVDTGVTKHPDLQIKKGLNVIKGETSFADQLGHGTHVAGIIAGRGKPGEGVRGAAPDVELWVYRVFGKDQERALSFNIAKGIRQAVDDGCDLINLSLGGAEDMPDVLREIHRARALGVVCIAATGNEYRSAVDYPARYSPVLSVSAFGRKGTWPAKAAQDLEVAKPYGTDPKDFVASFSNVGSEVKLTGPGVGVVSTYPKGYAVMDGTSMAAPALTGVLARHLSRNAKILSKMPRDQTRSDAIVKLALSQARKLGFGATFEGAGVLL